MFLILSHGEESPQLVPCFVQQVRSWLVRVLVSKRARREGERIIKVNFVFDFVHF